MKNYQTYKEFKKSGLNHTPERFRQKWLRPVTPVKNYYLTGQDISTCIMGAIAGGVITSSAILKRNIMAELIGQKNLLGKT